MNSTHSSLIAALSANDPSTRLQAALAIGSDASPDPATLDALLGRCRIEPDFFVRDMLTWALCRFPSDMTLPRLLAELNADAARARSQALHTLSKIKDGRAFSAITGALLHDPDDDVARSAWRAAVVLVPEGQQGQLAEELASQFGRGDGDVQLSLSRALIALGAEVIEPVLDRALASPAERIRAHASATRQLLRDPDAGSARAVHEARRQVLLKDRPA